MKINIKTKSQAKMVKVEKPFHKGRGSAWTLFSVSLMAITCVIFLEEKSVSFNFKNSQDMRNDMELLARSYPTDTDIRPKLSISAKLRQDGTFFVFLVR